MAVTALDLYRSGNATSARLDKVRTQFSNPNSLRFDIKVVQMNNTTYVVGRSGGASTFERPSSMGGRWWRLPAGSNYDDKLLFVWNDHGQHWQWEPNHDMPLQDYVSRLTAVNALFA